MPVPQQGKIKTAFILGAGLGMRLRPLTAACPKPLLAVAGRPLITYALDHCLTVGIERFIVNTHHLPEAYAEAFSSGQWRGRPLILRHEPVLLDTAGGLKNIEDLLTPEDETLLVYNGDVLSDLPLRRLLEAHAASGGEVTVVLRSRGPLLNVEVDERGNICDIRGLLGRPGSRRLCFTGIYAVRRCFFRRLAAGRAESVVPVFASLIREAPAALASVVIDEGLWQDMGDLETYEMIEREGVGLAGAADAPAGGSAAAEAPAGPLPAGDEGGNGPHPLPPWPSSREEAFVRHSLGVGGSEQVTFTPIGQGGSDRSYWRLTAGGTSAVLMRYSRSRRENALFAPLARYLDALGVSVPRLIAHDPGRRLILLDDLGDTDLFSLRGAAWPVRRRLYEKTLRLAALIHAVSPAALPAEEVPLCEPFSRDLYGWERGYFLKECAERACGLELPAAQKEALEEELSALAERLVAAPQALVHRDLQSQNVLVYKGEPFLIDFQGMRFGTPLYDVGSLLFDPYCRIEPGERMDLLRFYFDLVRPPCPWDEFAELFLCASVQRLMQALGAFGFLGVARGKTRFLSFLKPGLENLMAAAEELGGLPLLLEVAGRCRSALG